MADDGRILYARWDYIDRFNGPFISLWSTNPDGTNPQLVYGNYTAPAAGEVRGPLDPRLAEVDLHGLGPPFDQRRVAGAVGPHPRHRRVGGRSRG